mgnify:CR=1 FL=1
MALGEGQHEIAVSLDGFAPETRFVNITRDKRAVLAPIVLSKNPGLLRVTSEQIGRAHV